MVDIRRVADRQLQIVATRGRVMGDYTQGGTTATRMESRILSRGAPVPITGVRMAYGNFLCGTSGDVDAPNDITVEGVMESITGVFARRGFIGGASTRLLTAGAHFAISDPIGDLPAAAQIAIRTGVTVTAGQFVQYGVQPLTASDGFVESTSGTSQIQGTGALGLNGGASVTRGYGPLAILGYPQVPIPGVAIRGDSKLVGVADTNNNAGGIGFGERGLNAASAGQLPWANWARAGDSLQLETTIGHGWRRDTLMDWATHVLMNLGNNDPASGGMTFATMQTNAKLLLRAWRNRGCLIGYCTLTPRTTSTDAWATVVNQTVVLNYGTAEARGLYNAWVRALCPDTDGTKLIQWVIDTDAAVADPANPDKWRVDLGVLTGDGIHESAAGTLVCATPVTAIANTWG